MNNLNFFILFSTLIYFKLAENKSSNLKIAVGLVSLYALYNLFKGSEGFLNDPAPSTDGAGTTFCGDNVWVVEASSSPQFPAHCEDSSGKICGKYKNPDGTTISAPSPGYADLTDTKCNTIECETNGHCDSDGERYCHRGQCVVCTDNSHCDSDEKCKDDGNGNKICVSNTKECPSSCNFLQDPSPGEPGCGTMDINGSCADDPSVCCTTNYMNVFYGFLAIVGIVVVVVGLWKLNKRRGKRKSTSGEGTGSGETHGINVNISERGSTTA